MMRPQTKITATVLTFATLILCAIGFMPSMAAPLAPEFSHDDQASWLNSEPLRLEQMRGHPVLIEFWTFDCINCLRSIDWMKSITARKTKDGLMTVAVHTPELPREKKPENIRAAVAKLGIRYPVMLDIDYSYWTSMSNRYWPAFYLVDAEGKIVAQHFGELHVGEQSALNFERAIESAIERAQHPQ